MRGQAALRPGQKVTLSFRAMNLDGAGVAVSGQQAVAVPFALPGEEAVVEITRGGRRPEGKIVALIRKAARTAAPPCRHFGRCGGCQWQHLSYEGQLAQKTTLVKQYLAPVLRDTGAAVRDAVGADPWGYRNRIQAAFDVRQDKVVAGYYALRLGSGQAAGGDVRIINVQECPIQHAENVRLLHAVRDVVVGLDWPVYDRESAKGLVRGVIGQTGFASGETMVALSVTREVPDRMALVRAVRDRILNLVSLLLSVQPAHTSELLGQLRLLWGRPYIEDELAGFHVRVYASPAVPPNPKALPLWLDAIVRAAVVTGRETVADVACDEGLVPLALARRAARVVGVAPGRDEMHRAWENARLNAVDNCVFYTRAPAGVLAKLRARGERIDTVVVTSRGKPAAPAVFGEAAESGTQRIICAGHSLALLAVDLRAAAAAGYRPVEIQPVDLLPQTSRIHCVATLMKVH